MTDEERYKKFKQEQKTDPSKVNALKKAQEGKGFVSGQKIFATEFEKKQKQYGPAYAAKFHEALGQPDDWDEQNPSSKDNSATSKLFSNQGRQPGLAP